MDWKLAVDGFVVLLYFVVIIWIGLSVGKGSKNLQDFALGNRTIPWWAVLASILAAEISAGTFLGAPGDGFHTKNFTYAQLVIGTILARFIVAVVLIRPFYTAGVVSIYEYLEQRFGPLTRRVCSGIFLVTRSIASGTRLYVAAILLVIGWQYVTGSHPSDHQRFFLYVGALVSIVVLTAIYTAHGGIKAVIWTDVIQATILVLSLGVCVITLLQSVGGWQEARRLIDTQPNARAFLDLGWDTSLGVWANIKIILESEYTLWAAFLGSTFTTMATHGTDQDMVQRMLTAKNPKSSRIAIAVSGLIDLPIVLTLLFIGMLLWVYYQKNPDPNLPVANPEIFPWFIVNHLPVVVRGILVAGVLATAMGSLGTALNALATSWVRDFDRTRHRHEEGAVQLAAAKRATVVFSIILVVIGAATAALVIYNPDMRKRILPIVLGSFGYTYGCLLGIFLLAAFTKRRGSERGNIIAMTAGLLVVCYLSGLDQGIAKIFVDAPKDGPLPGLPRPEWMPVIEFPWRIMFGTVVTFCVAACFKTDPAKRTRPAVE